MDANIITLVSIALSNIGLILWFRAESRADWRQMDAKVDARLQAIHEEMKDFHGRLCAIEERRSRSD